MVSSFVDLDYDSKADVFRSLAVEKSCYGSQGEMPRSPVLRLDFASLEGPSLAESLFRHIESEVKTFARLYEPLLDGCEAIVDPLDSVPAFYTLPHLFVSCSYNLHRPL